MTDPTDLEDDTSSLQELTPRVQAYHARMGYHAIRADLERMVSSGEMAPAVARGRLAWAAGVMRDRLSRLSGGDEPMTDPTDRTPPPRVFRDRLIEARDAQRRALDNATLEDLQRETNRLLRMTLMEWQLQVRAAEFRDRMSRCFHGITVDNLIGFRRLATETGDEVAAEWAVRLLDGFRHRVVSPEDARKIDEATDRPDRINPGTVDSHLESLAGLSECGREEFADRAIADGSANACVAAFLAARDTPDGPGHRWVRKVLAGVKRFPEVAIAYLLRVEDGPGGAAGDVGDIDRPK